MTATLKELWARGLVQAPGCGDALTAILIERAGFDAVYMSGYQVSALLGHPDVGLVTMSEMVHQAGLIREATALPLIVDGDNGHGNAVNVIRTVREFERAGASAIHFEDQVLPKKCGHMKGHVLVSVGEMCGKIQAAVEARRSSEFLVFGRSDAIAATGLADAIERGRRYREAGADGIMVMAPRSIEDLREYRRSVDGPLMVTMGSWNLQVSAEELAGLGYQVALYPLTTMRRAVKAVEECLRELREPAGVDHAAANMIGMDELHHVLRLDRIQGWERRYTTPLSLETVSEP